MGCSNSKATEPQPEPVAKNPVGDGGAALPELDDDLLRMLEDAGLAEHGGIRKALRDNHCTMEVLKSLRDKGKLAQAIAEYGLGMTLSERLENAILAALDREAEEKRAGKASRGHVDGWEAKEAKKQGEESGNQTRGGQEEVSQWTGMSQQTEEKAEGTKGLRGYSKADTIKAVVAAGDAAEVVQEKLNKAGEVQEGVEGNAVLVDAGGDILEALGKALGAEKALEGVRDVVSDFVGVAHCALDVIGTIPFVAPVARLASLVVRQVAAEKATRALCKGLIPLCACALNVLKEAESGTKGLSGCKGELEKLRSALEGARGVVEAVRNRSFFRRALTAGRDAEGVKEAGEAVDNALREVVAAAAVGAAQTADRALDKARAVVSQLKSAEEMRRDLLEMIGGEGGSESEVLRKVEELGDAEWADMWSKLSAGERIAIAEARDAHRRIDELLMKQVASRYDPEVENLPPKLRDMWADELDAAPYKSIKWADVHDLIPDLKWYEKGQLLSDWGREHLQGMDLASFVEGVVKAHLAPDGDLWVKHLNAKSTRAKMKLKLNKDDLEAAHVLAVILEENQKAVEVIGDSNSGEDGVTRLRGTLGAHDFRSDCASRAAGFMEGTRDWLLDKIMTWARGQGEEGAKRMFALMSAPGMGKTAFTARVSEMLWEEGLLLAGHFIRVGDESRTDPKRVIKSLAVQIAETLGGDVAEAVRTAADGVNDGTMVWELAEQLVLEPLRQAGKDGDAGGKSLVVVIDALDEGGSERTNVLMSVLLRLVGALPEWVKVLVTTRPEPYIKLALERHEPFTLEPGDEQNRADLRAFIRGSLSKDLEEDVREEAVRVLEGKSEGVIGYVAAVMAMVREGMGRKGGAGGSRSLAEVKLGELPTGLATLYTEYMERQFRHLGDAERRAVKERMLPALAVAEEPLLVRDVERLVKHGGKQGTEMEDEAVGRVVLAAGSLFPVAEDGRIRPFHKSVLDWLLDESSGDWHVDEACGHAVHARTWGQVASEVGTWVQDGESLRLVGEYGGRHALMHAARSGDVALAHRVCTTLQLIRAGVEAGAAGLLVRGAAACDNMASGSGGDSGQHAADISTTFKWLREFAPELAVSRGYTIEAAQLTPAQTWTRNAAVAVLEGNSGGYQGVLPMTTPTMSYLPDDIILKGHMCLVKHVVVCENGATVVTASQDNTARIWDARTGEVRHTLEGHTGPVNSVAVCENGAMVVTASDDNTARIWDARTGELKHTLEGHCRPVNNAAICEDGDIVVTSSWDGNAIIWDVKTGELRHTLESHRYVVNHVVVSDDGATVVTASDDRTAIIWDARTGEMRHTLKGHWEAVKHVAIGKDGGTVVTASQDCMARIWDARTGELRHTLEGHTHFVNFAAVCEDGAMVITTSDDRTARIWDTKTGELRHTLEGHTMRVNHAVVFEERSTVVTVSDDGTALIWDARTGELKHMLDGHTGPVKSVAVCENRSTIVTASSDNTARVWYVGTGEPRHTLDGHTAPVTHVAICEDGSMVVTASSDTTARIWDTKTGKLRHTLTGHTHYVNHVAVCKDGRTLVTASNDGTARIWDARTGELRHTLEGHVHYVKYGVVCEDGATVVTASDDTTAKIWDAMTGELRQTLNGHTQAVRHAAIGKDGATSVTASRDRTVLIWDTTTGKIRSILRGQTSPVNHVAVCGNGRKVVTASDDGTARIWDARTCKLRRTLLGHTNRVTHAAVCEDGSTVVTASCDKTARIWDGKTGELKHTLEGHTAEVNHVAMYEHDAIVITCSRDKTVRIWSLSSGHCIAAIPTWFYPTSVSLHSSESDVNGTANVGYLTVAGPHAVVNRDIGALHVRVTLHDGTVSTPCAQQLPAGVASLVEKASCRMVSGCCVVDCAAIAL